jgi:drug/metabolite transporter (DMT)-like permease
VARWYLLLVGISAGWGTIPLILREVDVAPSTIAFGRVLVAAVGLGVVLRLQPGERGFPRPYSVAPARCLANGALLAAHWLTMFIAFDRAPAGTVILIIFLAPVGVAAIAPRLLGEHRSTAIVVAIALGLVGVALIAGPAVGDADPVGLAMAGVSMVLLIALNLASKPLVGVYGGLRLAFMETAGAALALAPVAAVLHTGSVTAAWPWLLLLGLVHTAFGVTMYLSALRHLPVTHVSILSYLEPVSVVMLAWLVLAERPTVLTLAGGGLVVAAGLLVVTAGREVSMPPEPVTHVGMANASR